MIRAALALAALAAACSSTYNEPLRPQQWFEIPVGVASIDQPDVVEIEDGGLIGLAGGYDFARGGLRPGIELGVIGSANDVDVPATGDLDVVRYMAGMRLAADLGELPLTVYVRGGYEFRTADGTDIDALDQNDSGYYAGFGLDWWYTRWGSMGVFGLYGSGFEDGDFEEWLFGLVFRFGIPWEDWEDEDP